MLGEVIAIGDELTSGERLDTNSQWLSQRLTEQGVEVRYHTTVGDDLEANTEVFRAATARADVVVATGGLGPTADDLTREAIAAVLGVGLVRDDAALDHIRQMFHSRGRSMPERNARQADFPEGAAPIPNPSGTAPGVQAVIDRPGRGPCVLFALPGVPAEAHDMWRATVSPAVAAASPRSRVIRHRRLKCFGAGESHLEAMLPDLIRRGRDPRVGITASGATITLRITAAGPDEASAFEAMRPTLATIRQSLGELVFGEEDDELEHAVRKLLGEKGGGLATAESWSAGLVAGWLAGVGVKASSRVGGEPAFGDDEVGALAAAVRSEASADFGLAIGAPFSPPAPHGATTADASTPNAAGSVAISLVAPDAVVTKRYPLVGHPSIVKPRIAKLALNQLRLHLLNANQ
ncbi:MAG: CinA family nicotinamide mononucleotide deamidase-related protein [Planctomycetota bacterium]